MEEELIIKEYVYSFFKNLINKGYYMNRKEESIILLLFYC